MVANDIHHSNELPAGARDYLAQRLDGARDLYLLALGLGARREGARAFGVMIREARIHFVAVIEEARIAGLDTQDIAAILGRSDLDLGDGIHPDLRDRVEHLLTEATRERSQRRAG